MGQIGEFYRSKELRTEPPSASSQRKAQWEHMGSKTKQTADRVGERIADRFRLDALLGEGGMGSVFKAFDTELERPVAIKLIKNTLARDPQFAIRFKREAKVAARFQHPNSIQVFDYSAGGNTDTGELYMVLEFVQGHELQGTAALYCT